MKDQLMKAGNFEASLRAELPVLYRVAKRLVNQAEDAEDLVGMTILRAHQGWSKFDGRHLRSWLVRILRNEFLKSLRGKKEEHSIDDLEQEIADSGEVWSTIADNLSSEIILQELNRIPTDFALVIQLCDIEEMSYEEASMVLDVPVGTVRSRLFRARSLLRQRLSSRILEQV